MTHLYNLTKKKKKKLQNHMKESFKKIKNQDEMRGNLI